MDLFHHAVAHQRIGQPLAERMRPKTLAEVLGQAHLIGEGSLLRRILYQPASSDAYLPSLILYGPPGTGKTTLCQLLAQHIGARFVALSAVQSGIKELRQALDEARDHLSMQRRKTVLFIDEVHRYNKTQQDALLPAVESGQITLVGATTENPSFELNAALLSRCRVLRLAPLSPEALDALLDRALADAERGLGKLPLVLSPPLRTALVRSADGDARRLLVTMEALAHLSTPDQTGTRHPTQQDLEQALSHKTLLFDKGGDQHHDLISALIKSMRGSDPDAAIYYAMRMLESGEDPFYVLRRLVIFASEDIGLADSRALPLAMAAVDAVRFVGLPEGRLTISHLVLFLATAPKSNSALVASQAAAQTVTEQGALPVPKHLRDGHSGTAKALGHGDGYLYPHDHPGHYVEQQYLPDALIQAQLYSPSDSGAERPIAERLVQLRSRRAP